VHQDFYEREHARECRWIGTALALYAALGLLIWVTVGDIPIPVSRVHFSRELDFAVHITLRQLTLLILATFVVRTILHHGLGEQQDK
jgi:hypothetical protein